MDKKYIIPVALLLVLAVTLVLLPKKKAYEELPATELLKQVTGTARFVSTDEVADRLIRKDPSMLLVDVRSSDQFNEYAIPGSVNIPLQDILKSESQEMLSQEGLDIIFYSTGEVYSDQAWITARRMGKNNIYVMKGGLNEWFSDFFMTQPPAETASGEEITKYQFRSAVRQYFTGGELKTEQKTSGENISVTPKKKKSAAEGGC